MRERGVWVPDFVIKKTWLFSCNGELKLTNGAVIAGESYGDAREAKILTISMGAVKMPAYM